MTTNTPQHHPKTATSMLASSKYLCVNNIMRVSAYPSLLFRHCVGGSSEASTCERKDRDYNIGLRIGLIFPMLAGSAIGEHSKLCCDGSRLIRSSCLRTHASQEPASHEHIEHIVHHHQAIRYRRHYCDSFRSCTFQDPTLNQESDADFCKLLTHATLMFSNE